MRRTYKTRVSRLLDDCAVFKVRQEGARGDSAVGLSKLNSMQALTELASRPEGPNRLARRALRPDPVDIRYTFVISTSLYCNEGRDVRSNPGASLERR